MQLIKNKFLLIIIMAVLSCNQPIVNSEKQTGLAGKDWRSQFDQSLPLLGHRNWIVIADKALPQQNAAGIEYIYTNEKLLPVLKYVMEQINTSGHIKPIIYQDKELSFITNNQAKGVKEFSDEAQQLFGVLPVQTILHDSVFTKLDAASKLFKVLVLKTNETIPYTSVFLELDCAYWNADKEKQLRDKMKKP